MVTSPTPGTFVIALHFKGRDKPILEMDLKIDDLLEKVSLLLDRNIEIPWLIWITHLHNATQQKDNNTVLDLEYVQLNVPKVLALLNKVRLADPR
jgi:Ras GTPase-activating-like protein IQGAP2/3